MKSWDDEETLDLLKSAKAPESNFELLLSLCNSWLLSTYIPTLLTSFHTFVLVALLPPFSHRSHTSAHLQHALVFLSTNHLTQPFAATPLIITTLLFTGLTNSLRAPLHSSNVLVYLLIAHSINSLPFCAFIYPTHPVPTCTKCIIS